MVLDWILAVEPRDLEGRLTLDAAVFERDRSGSTVLWRLRDLFCRFGDGMTEPWKESRPGDRFQQNSSSSKRSNSMRMQHGVIKRFESLTNVGGHI